MPFYAVVAPSDDTAIFHENTRRGTQGGRVRLRFILLLSQYYSFEAIRCR